jgi:hypothetical protein
VIKTVAYFPSQCALNSPPVIDAVIHSLHNCGITTCVNSTDSDAVIIWSVLWSGRMLKNQHIYRLYRQLNRPVIVIDVGTLRRGTTWKIAVNHINNQGYYGHTENVDAGRPAALGIELKQLIKPRPSILIAAQHSRSLQLESVEQETWIMNTIEQLQNYTDRPIVVRPHPRCRLQINGLPKNVTMEIPKKIPSTYDNFDIDYNYHAVVNYNSGPGIQAAIAGTRIIVDRTSLAHPVSTSIDCIENAITIDRQQWLAEICHTEYTIEEIKQGLWLTRLQSALTV